MILRRIFSICTLIILALVMAVWTPAAASAGSGWLPVGMPAFSSDTISTISLALDGNNIPYVAFDRTNLYGTVMKYN